jgi:hypothetical protein
MIARTPGGRAYAAVFNAARQRPFERWATKNCPWRYGHTIYE